MNPRLGSETPVLVASDALPLLDKGGSAETRSTDKAMRCCDASGSLVRPICGVPLKSKSDDCAESRRGFLVLRLDFHYHGLCACESRAFRMMF